MLVEKSRFDWRGPRKDVALYVSISMPSAKSGGCTGAGDSVVPPVHGALTTKTVGVDEALHRSHGRRVGRRLHRDRQQLNLGESVDEPSRSMLLNISLISRIIPRWTGSRPTFRIPIAHY